MGLAHESPVGAICLVCALAAPFVVSDEPAELVWLHRADGITIVHNGFLIDLTSTRWEWEHQPHTEFAEVSVQLSTDNQSVTGSAAWQDSGDQLVGVDFAPMTERARRWRGFTLLLVRDDQGWRPVDAPAIRPSQSTQETGLTVGPSAASWSNRAPERPRSLPSRYRPHRAGPQVPRWRQHPRRR